MSLCYFKLFLATVKSTGDQTRNLGLYSNIQIPFPSLPSVT